MRATIGWRTTSALENCVKAMPRTSFRTCMASTRPLLCVLCRSTCVTSPVTTALLPKPIRVRNIFICSAVVFWASSRITNAWFRVRPRMNASGAISITCFSNSFCVRSKPSRSYSASYSGRR